jgi:thymidylate kinase
MYVHDDQLAIYDWELSQQNTPIGFDAFHFIIQSEILQARKPWIEIHKTITKDLTANIYPDWNTDKVNTYLNLYLLINTVNYLDIYSKQPQWHEQIHWLLETWSLAISHQLSSFKKKRRLMLIDFFDFMNTKEYAAIKFPNTFPDMLNEYSDVDICIRKSDEKGIIQYLKNHPLVHFVYQEAHSNMSSIQLFFEDSSLLSIDLIWRLSRKEITMLNSNQVLAGSVENSYGVKHMNNLDTARYIALFYGLNNSEIPEKYQVYKLAIDNGRNKLDHLLHKFYVTAKINNDEVITILNQNPENSFVNKLLVGTRYLIDSFLQGFQNKGLTITFSGVDGAGKSTVIESIKYEIEKKLRKKVVVLRHRPSILPILSSFVKGKAKAESDAAKNLPRQGNNTSGLNSLLRFSYYYIDYLVGQVYINIRYIRRGYVVLYDRYYFDFINDSKRSNIKLPKFILKAGYHLLFKPDLNFFLFANPDIILSRKKELDRFTIQTLTKEYIELFEELNNEEDHRHYTIENIELQKTIDLIMDKTMGAVA